MRGMVFFMKGTARIHTCDGHKEPERVVRHILRGGAGADDHSMHSSLSSRSERSQILAPWAGGAAPCSIILIVAPHASVATPPVTQEESRLAVLHRGAALARVRSEL